MTLPTGTITMNQVNVELGKTGTNQISLNDSDVRSLAGKSSGQISLDDLRGKSAEIPVTSGLVLYLDPDDSSSYSGSGTNWNNLITSGSRTSKGTLVNGPYYTAGANTGDGGYFTFDGGNDRVDFDTFDFGNAISLFCFVRPENRYSIRTLFSNTYASNYADGVHFYLNDWNTVNNSIRIEYRGGSGPSSSHTASTTVTNDAWQSLTFAYDKSTNRTVLYKNGTQQGLKTTTTLDGDLNERFKIGRFQGTNNYFYKGRIGIYLLYNKELSSTEVSQLHSHFKSLYGL